MVEIIWKEPPPAVSSEKLAVLTELRKNPGRWALVQRAMASSSATAPWVKLGCEAVYRKSEDQPKKFDIYARWPERPAKPPLQYPPGVRGGMENASHVKDRVVAPAGTEPKPPRPAGPGTYDPGLGRAARGVPEEGMPVATLTTRRLADRPQA